MIYLDNAATTRIDDKVLEAMMPYLKENYGNPSTPYEIGIKSAIAIENARKQFSKAFNCNDNEIFFTGGGSEGDNWVLKSFAFDYYFKHKERVHIITSKIEHSAILATCQYLTDIDIADVTYINVESNGVVDFEEIENVITNQPTLISIMTVNNETGVIQPIKEIGDICSKYDNVYFHTDATQAVGHIKIDVSKWNIDYLTCSAHKFYGPKGVGVVYIKDDSILSPLIHGGHQERSYRAGTENVAGIVGAGYAIEKAMSEIDEEDKNLRNIVAYFINGLYLSDIDFNINGDLTYRVAGTINISFGCLTGQRMQLLLDSYGICVSTGSACNSGMTNPSHVLTAMGIPDEEALRAVRFSFGKYTTYKDVDYVLESIKDIYNNFR